MNYRTIRRMALGLLFCTSAILTWHQIQSDRLVLPVSEGTPEATGEAGLPVEQPALASRPGNLPQMAEKIQVFTDADLAPLWSVKFGEEFWRRQTPYVATEATEDSSALLNPPFSLGDVIERVTHALTPDPATGLPQVDAGNYLARFDGQGLQFTPYRPAEVQAETGTKTAEVEDSGQSHSGKTRPIAISGRPVPDPAAQIHFRTESIQRDGGVYFSANGNTTEWSVVGDTAQALLSPAWGMVEHYEAGKEGVAVSWVFPQPLPGIGPIEVVASVEGLSYAGESDGGLHFADSTGVSRVCVGQAFAVDAAGTRWELAMQKVPGDNSRLLVELPAEIQAEAVYPLVIDPIIGAEFGMDQPVSSAASGNQGNPAITSGAGMFFVVWEDSRNSRATSTDIYGTRVSSEGVIKDPLGLAICTATASQTSPSVAVFGTTFMVVWRDRRLGGNDIFGARVSSTGVLLDPLGLGISIDPAQNSKAAPAVAGGSPGFMVVWEDNRNSPATGTDIYGARVNTLGVVLDPLGVAICANAADEFNPTVVTNSTGFFVAWEDNRNSGTTGTDIYGARVSSAGALLDPAGVALSTAASSQTEAAAAANGSTVLVTWRDRRTSGTTSDDIYGTRINFTNNAVNVLNASGFPICTNPASQRTPAVCANTNGFLVVWRDRRNTGTTEDDIYGARIDANGLVLEPSGFVVCANLDNQTVPAVAGSPSGALVVWTDPRYSANTGNDIFGARVSVVGVVQETNGVVVSRSGAAQSAPAVAFNGTNYLVVWQDERNFTTNDTDIIGVRVTAAGKLADLKGINICTLAGAQQEPAVAASGGQFLVVWEESRNSLTTGVDIYGTRVTGAGMVLDPAGLALSTATGNEATPAVAGNPATFLVAWEDSRNGGGSAPGIYGTLVSQAGLISNPAGLVITATGGNEIRPSIGAAANGFLVVWEDNNDLFAARVTNGGVVSDPSGSAIRIASNGSETWPVVAALGTNYLVAWMDDRNSGETGLDIYAARVFGDGTVPDFDGFPICTLPNNQVNPAVASSLDSYVVVWQNQGAGSQASDLRSARISAAGAVLDFWSVPLVGTGDRVTPCLAHGGAGKFLLVSEGFRSNSRRIAANLMTGEPPLANGLVQFSSTAYSVAENGKFAKVTVALAGAYSGVVTVDLATADGTALAGADYMPQATRLVFSNKKTSVIVYIPIIDNLTHESNETVTLALQNPLGGALLGPRHTATLTILDNDP